ncbi:NAD(P)/FAD-dependent oxidoreductase [Nocardia sp. NPDC050697]|uniref:flavin-containing monooxygenase n=1 Tax=Nocardia sp. NPDC050697 TaxID=3155158 RepID=UPI0033FEB2DE
MRANDVRAIRVAVVGAGFGGICTALRLRAAGHTAVTVFDARAGVGGTWAANRYPGVACDAPSHVYSYSFTEPPAWSRRFAPGAEIRDYLERCADGLEVRTGTAVTAAEWTGRDWLLTLGDGGTERFEVLVAATGQLAVPAVPPLPGLAEFGGRVLHTADWPDDFDPRGRRIVVVGTGASAVQLVPELVQRAAAVTVVQRSAPYVMPKPDVPYRVRALHRRFPAVRRATRAALWTGLELITLGFWRWPALLRPLERAHARVLERTVADPALRAALTPRDRAGCKRILMADGYHAAFTRPHVALVTAPITGIEPGAVRTATGRYPADTLIFATGFDTGGFATTLDIRGRTTPLAEHWSHGARAHLGLTVPGFPNFFLVYGPNTNLGSGSILFMLETQAAHITAAVTRLAAAPAGAALEVTEAAFARWSRLLDRRFARPPVWNSGCRSWYRDAAGRDTHNWPGALVEYRLRAGRPRRRDYRLAPAPS